MAESGKEPIAVVGQVTGELTERMLGRWARYEFTVTDRKRRNNQQPLVNFRQPVYVVG